MDQELKAYLDGMEQRMTQNLSAQIEAARAEAAARDAETRTLLGAQIEASRAEAAARDAETRQRMDAMEQHTTATTAKMDAIHAKIDEVRRQAGADRDDIIREIRALPEALSTHQRAEADRLDAAREEAMLNHHVLPLEAGAANHEQRIQTLEQR